MYVNVFVKVGESGERVLHRRWRTGRGARPGSPGKWKNLWELIQRFAE